METILELCKEIDENDVEKIEDEEQAVTTINKDSWIPKRQSSSSSNRRNSVIHQVAFPAKKDKCWESSDDDMEDKANHEEKGKGGKKTISYSVKKEITETMTLTKED